MKTGYWDRKNLNTSLSAWTELKHDMILYSEQPFAAEAGGGDDGPPEPRHIAYVEPNINFWNKAIELLSVEEKILGENNLLTRRVKTIDSTLTNLAVFLRDVSNVELNGGRLSDAVFNDLDYIGGYIERLTFDIVGSDHLPERDQEISLITDVYTYNDSLFINKKLIEAVGRADDIYVIAEINGLPYITKGAVFSYYEFLDEKRKTDDEWKNMISEKKLPQRPVWMNDIIVPVEVENIEK
jgi:hypothetical protein